MAEVRIAPGAGPGGGVDVQVGDVLAVDLPENPTTGYVWSVAGLPGVLGELPGDRAGPEQDAEQDDARSAGAAGRRVLRFAAREAGTGELTLRHGRPWQSGSGEELRIPIRVEAAP
jgi:inhibitor of cysteine peptidase